MPMSTLKLSTYFILWSKNRTHLKIAKTKSNSWKDYRSCPVLMENRNVLTVFLSLLNLTWIPKSNYIPSPVDGDKQKCFLFWPAESVTPIVFKCHNYPWVLLYYEISGKKQFLYICACFLIFCAEDPVIIEPPITEHWTGRRKWGPNRSCQIGHAHGCGGAHFVKVKVVQWLRLCSFKQAVICCQIDTWQTCKVMHKNEIKPKNKIKTKK